VDLFTKSETILLEIFKTSNETPNTPFSTCTFADIPCEDITVVGRQILTKDTGGR
jgi:hypothetical protein